MELFIKRFIDLLDEKAPVSMVHTIVEQPLGAISIDSYVKIHARLDLVDEDSPFVEIELYPYPNNKIELLFAYTFPKKSIILKEEDFKQKLISNEHIIAEKIVSINDENEKEESYYEIFYKEDIEVPQNNGEIDEVIHQIVPTIKEWLLVGGYEVEVEE